MQKVKHKFERNCFSLCLFRRFLEFEGKFDWELKINWNESSAVKNSIKIETLRPLRLKFCKFDPCRPACES